MIYIVIVSVLLGLVIGYSSPLVIPVAYSKIFSVALVAALDAAFGGLRAVVSERFDKRVFVTGFFSNTLLAAADTSPCCAIPERRVHSHRFAKIFLHYRNVADFMVKYTRKNTVY